jgi:hypothetical protein
LAWKSIEKESGKDQLNLDDYGKSQATAKCLEAQKTVKARLRETYCWLLAPEQADSIPGTPLAWGEHKRSGDAGLIVPAEKKMVQDGSFVAALGGVILRSHLDGVPLWREAFTGKKEHVSVQQLMDDFALYTYLPRLRDPQVLVEAVRSGASLLTWNHTFAYAEGVDETSARYLGLQMGSQITALASGFVVHPDAAMRQIEAERPAPVPVEPEPLGTSPSNGSGTSGGVSTGPSTSNGASTSNGTGTSGGIHGNGIHVPVVAARPTRFFGSVEVNTLRAGRDMDQLAQEIIRYGTND